MSSLRVWPLLATLLTGAWLFLSPMALAEKAALIPVKQNACPKTLMGKTSPSQSIVGQVLRGGGFSIDNLIDELSKDPQIGALFVSDAGVAEKITIREHVLRVYQQYKDKEAYYGLSEIRVPLGSSVDQMLRITIALHDIGKPLAVAAGDVRRQHEFTIPILKRKLQEIGLPEKAIEICVALAGHDIFGDLIKWKTITPRQAYDELKKLAATTPLTTSDFIKLAKFFYTIDATSYDNVLKNFFRRDGYINVPKSEAYSQFERIVNDGGKPIPAPDWFREHRRQFDPLLREQVKTILKQKPQGFTKTGVPIALWELEEISSLLDKLSQTEQQHAKKGFESPTAILSEIFQEPKIVPLVADLRAFWQGITVIGPYVPTEFELKTKYLEKLQILNRFLPKTAQLAIPRIDRASRVAQIAAAERVAQSIMARIKANAAQMFPSTGYPDITAFQQAMSKNPSVDPKVRALLDSPEQLQFVMNRPQVSRGLIFNAGFYSVHATGLTQGGSSVGGTVGIRSVVEASNLMMAPHEFEQLEARPQYGYLRANPQSTGLSPPFIGYGEDVWGFKKDRVQRYTSFAVGDSMNQWLDKDGQRIVISDTRISAPVTSWSQVFQPWDNSSLLLHFLTVNVKSILLIDAKRRLDLNRANYPAERYIELENWKPQLDLDDVEFLEFKQTPPSPEELKELKRRHITIYDDRPSRVPQPWPQVDRWPPPVWDEID